ncbi:DNA-binding transcriptional regulator, IclR family [Paramicrobacterium humi]|uniref:Glycerol operon regulatory protein n=1 Tax=Paramicrobacterium humi TaxID=640635 RepID=A0A1H4JEX9_9MICO|nr:helix-turn-helix domain-containing protein [Microbacterium humi]SEB44870.1 DNA-binding transcriptional regulator, IclR family [Microbacterium humi]
MADAATARTTKPRPSSPASQTLSRGIQILELLADARGSLAIDEVAQALGLHRSIAYRLLRTLEDHGLVVRDANGRVMLGAHMATLAAGVARDLQTEALPELTEAANELGITCFLGVLDQDQCVTLVSIEPRHAVASVAQRPGARHPVTVGAPGKVIMSMLSSAEWPADVSDRLRADMAETLERGYATSHDEVIPTVKSVAVPLALRGRRPAALAAVYVGPAHDPAMIAERLARSAATIRDALGS